MLRSKFFDLPPIDYFQSKNIFTGSLGDFNYKITPGESLKVLLWFGAFCSEKSEIAAQKEFPITADGRDDLVRWLEEQHQTFLPASCNIK